MIKIELIRRSEQQTSDWTGGTTTQLAIYPREAAYGERNFQWRLSSAKVEIEESIFTSLPGIWRLIMVLEGDLKLEHEGHHQVTLKPYEKDSFSGGWVTKSFGKVTDFNLMMAAGCQGELQAILLEAKESIAIDREPEKNQYIHSTEGLYCIDGVVDIDIVGKSPITLYEGDLCLIHRAMGSEDVTITLQNQEDHLIHVVRVIIHY